MFSSLFLFLPWTDDKGISLLSQVWWIICHWKRSGAYASSFALYNHFDGSLGKSIMQTGRVLLFFFNNIRLLWCPLWVTSNWQSLQWSKAIQWGSNFLQTIQLEKKKICRSWETEALSSVLLYKNVCILQDLSSFSSCASCCNKRHYLVPQFFLWANWSYSDIIPWIILQFIISSWMWISVLFIWLAASTQHENIGGKLIQKEVYTLCQAWPFIQMQHPNCRFFYPDLNTVISQAENLTQK